MMNYFHSAASIAHKEAKAKTKGKKKEIPRSAKEQHKLSRVPIPRRARTLLVRDATANFMSSTLLRQNTVCVDQSVPRRSRRPWRVDGYQPFRRWKFSEWFWWPRNTPKTRRWHTGSTSCKRLGCPGASSSGQPSLGTGTVRSVATSPSTASARSTSTAGRGVVDNGSLASASRGRRTHWGPVKYGHENGSDWCDRPFQNNVRVRKHEPSTGLVW